MVKGAIRRNAFPPGVREFDLAYRVRIGRSLLMDGGTITRVRPPPITVLEAPAALRPESLDSEDTRRPSRNHWLTTGRASGHTTPRTAFDA
jgi:hypothetical protein